MIVGLVDPRGAGPAALLAESRAFMARLFPQEENHYLNLDALAGPDVRFVAATDGRRTLGTGAVLLRNGYGEVKSMFTAPSARGNGVADAVLRHLIDLSAAEGRPVLRLETGRGLDAAHRLYARHGFVTCGPFGPYLDTQTSLFFQRVPSSS
ncbi:MAG: GNAT family N-acetyltransferase [Pseudomonadota bacterium]